MGWCDECGSIDMSRLYGTVDARRYCSTCWKEAGSPWPRRKATAEEVAALERRIAERKLKRGANRYRDQSGKGAL